MFSRILSAPFLILAVGFLYMTWEVSNSYSWYIIPCVIVLAIIYILSPQIDWWWAKRNPPDVDEKVGAMIHQHSDFYKRLSPNDKRYFRNRVALYLQTKEFMPQAFERVPEDIKGMLAAGAVQVTFGREDFLMEPFDNIVVYPDAFPSPQYPKDRHSTEVYSEDGVLLVSARHIAHSFLESRSYYPLAIHSYVQVFLNKYPALDYPDAPENTWEGIEEVSGFSEKKIKEWIGLPLLDSYVVFLTCFFAFPKKFEYKWPELYQALVELFTLDPAHPVSTAPLVS